MYTTLNEIQKHKLSQYSWEKLLRYLNKTYADEQPLPLLTVLESNGFEDALWCVKNLYDKKSNLKLAVLFAREVQHGMPEESVQALAVFERYVDGNATDEEFQEARKAAWETAHSAEAARNAVWREEGSAADAYAASARAASAGAAAFVSSPSNVAYAASNAAYAAPHTDAVDAAVAKFEMQAKQTQILRKFLEETL